MAIVLPIFTATAYLSKYLDVTLDSWICVAPNTAKLDLTAPAPRALSTEIRKIFSEESRSQI